MGGHSKKPVSIISAISTIVFWSMLIVRALCGTAETYPAAIPLTFSARSSEAVEAITGETAPVACQPAPVYRSEAGKLVLPPKAEGKYDRVFAYLAETRGISPAVISDFMKSKQIYQDTKGNCVFVGYDEKGTAKFGAVRTTLTDRKYRGDCKNSDKRYAFHQIGTDTTRLYVFEAPIDLLSHCTMTDQAFGKTGAYKEQTRLALCGSSDVALKAFLERHPEVTTINFRLDNDEAGRNTRLNIRHSAIRSMRCSQRIKMSMRTC